MAEGEVPLIDAELSDFEQILAWADELRELNVRANADTPADAKKARFGAQGIGLCRTEHMFMQDGRLELMRAMILSEDEEASREALGDLEPLQRGDFEEIFEAMDGLPVTVRLLDPPLHEFLPTPANWARGWPLWRTSSGEASELRRQLRVVENLEEANPMLGLRAAAWA